MSQPSDQSRIVVITGAASGIGHATAELFRDLGDTVYGLDIAPTVPDGVTYVECNVGDKAAVDAAIATCAESGRIDVLANVAGIVQFGRFEGITEAEYDRVQAVDLKGPFFLIQAALPHIRAAEGQHRQRLVGGRQQAAGLLRGVLRGQGRADPAHPGAGPRAGARGHPGQRRLPRHRGHPARPARGGELPARPRPAGRWTG